MGFEGRRVVVTRDERKDGPLSTLLARAGAVPLLRPTLTFEFESGDSPLDEAVARIGDFDWLVVTSGRTVDALAGVGLFDHPAPTGLKISAVGPGSAAAVEARGWGVDLAPESGGGAHLARRLGEVVQPGVRLLLPASAAAGAELPDHLRSIGCVVERVTAYGPAARPQDPGRWANDLDEGLDALTFTSPSALAALLDGIEAALADRLRLIPAAAQGPTTAAALRDADWGVIVEATPTTFEGLVTTLARHFDDAA